MKQLIRFDIEAGGNVIIEVETAEEKAGTGSVGRSKNIITQATQTLDAALENVKPAAEAVLRFVTNLSENPDEIEVEFGLKASAETGAIIASAGIEANFIVKMKWVREKHT